MQITMTISTLSNGCSSASAERDSTLTEEQALDEAIVVIGVSISCWNPFSDTLTYSELHGIKNWAVKQCLITVWTFYIWKRSF